MNNTTPSSKEEAPFSSVKNGAESLSSFGSSLSQVLMMIPLLPFLIIGLIFAPIIENINFFGPLFFVVIYSFLLLYVTQHTLKITSHSWIVRILYGLLLVLPVAMLYFLTSTRYHDLLTNSYTKGIFSFAIFLSVVGLIYFAIYVIDNFVSYLSILYYVFDYIMIFAMAMVFMAFIFEVFKFFKISLSPEMKLVIRILFYIPCLITEFIKYIEKETKITPPIVWVLLAFEIVLILCYLYFPRLMQAILLGSGKLVLNKTVFLNENTIIDTSAKFNSKNLRSYSLVAWIYVNPQPSNVGPAYTKETVVMNYGSLPYGKPRITYFNKKDDDAGIMRGTYRVYVSNTDVTSVDINIPDQRWNCWVFNYLPGQKVDIFINGDLVRSIAIVNPVAFHDVDNITVGEHNGIYGAICNIMFFENPLNKMQITSLYNMMRTSNPPILPQ